MKPYKIRITGPPATWSRVGVIDTTSKSKTKWQTDLSPFHLGPVKLYDGNISQTMENGWQYAKVYPGFTDKRGNPSKDYWRWAKDGWANKRAVRYPIRKGAKPLYSYWRGEKLDYISARAKIYIPLYCRAVLKTEGFKKLLRLHREGPLTLWDYDGYDYEALGMTMEEVILNPNRTMGHAFVLAYLIHKIDARKK